MFRNLLAAIAFPAVLMGAAAADPAKIPDPANCEVPGLITLVARGPDGSADPLGSFTVVVKDFNNVPKQNVLVVLDFHGCSDIRICANQGDPSTTEDCLTRTIREYSDVDGRARFRVLGCAANTGASPGSIGPSLDVYADGVWLNRVRVAALDQNGLAGVDGGDLSLFLTDYISGQGFARSDYDGNGVVDGNDLSLWLAAFMAGGSAVPGGSACP
jgi:hypothetical protein